MENNTDWIQHYGFILVAFAHMTDWKLLDCELQLIQEKMEFIISNSNKEYTSEDVAQNLIQIITKLFDALSPTTKIYLSCKTLYTPL